jgi:hypothetical protein
VKLPLIAVALLALLVLSPLSQPASAAAFSKYVFVDSYVNSTRGFATNGAGPYTNPGPTFSMLDNQTLQITLHATDNKTHIFYVDVDKDGKISQGDLISNNAYDRAAPWYAELQLAAGTYTYRDATYGSMGWLDSGISGEIKVTPHPVPPEPLWHWDPFWIFGLFVILALVGWVLYMLAQGVKIYANKKKLRMTNPEIHKWLKAVMDPEGPTRPNEAYISNIKLAKRKMREDKEKESGESGTPRSRLSRILRALRRRVRR